MKRKLIEKLIVAAVLAATAPAQAEAVRGSTPALAEALLPLRDAITPTRRPIDALPCGLLAIGRAAPRTAAPVESAPLLAIEGATVDDSRRARAAYGTRESELHVLGDAGQLVVQRIERSAAPLGLIALDPELLVKSRLARAFAAR